MVLAQVVSNNIKKVSKIDLIIKIIVERKYITAHSYVTKLNRRKFRSNARRRASADLMATVLAIDSTNPPRNGNHKDYAITTTNITSQKAGINFAFSRRIMG